MPYFVNVRSLEDLKSQYRVLAHKHHPDLGGDQDAMKAVNNEYDQLFPVWKHRSADTSNETAASTRSEFYTANGWKGENYNPRISLKEIACIIREYVKDVHNDYKFSITTVDHRCLYVVIVEAPADVFTEDSEKIGHLQGIDGYAMNRYTRDKYKLTPEATVVITDIQKLITSYNRDDSDAMTDYFDRHFYDRFHLGKWDEPYKIVPRAKRAPTHTEYETVQIMKKRSFKTLEPHDIKTPTEYKVGQQFQLKGSFNYGCSRGTVYQITRIYDGARICAHKLGKGYKNVCTGNTRGNSFSARPDQMAKWLDNGSISFVKLIEVIKTEEYASSVRRPKKKTGMVVADERSSAETADMTQTSGTDYTITPDTDTRDNSPLWVLKFNRTLPRSEFLSIKELLRKHNGWYSSFKHGFIFREDPSELLPIILVGVA